MEQDKTVEKEIISEDENKSIEQPIIESLEQKLEVPQIDLEKVAPESTTEKKLEAQPAQSVAQTDSTDDDLSSEEIQWQEKTLAKVEEILQTGLEDIFMSLEPQTQKAFKIKGEQTAKTISKILSQTKINIKKIIDVLREWMLLIPGVNKFFLEQEIKIKTDKILKIKEIAEKELIA